jgi:polar amino acid transport system permease protein
MDHEPVPALGVTEQPPMPTRTTGLLEGLDPKSGWRLWTLAALLGYGVFAVSGSKEPLGRLVAAVTVGPEGEMSEVVRYVLAACALAATLAIGAVVRLLPFRVQVAVVWALLLGAFVAFAYNFDLKYALIEEKFPYLAGFRLDPRGFILGAALTLYLSVISIFFSCVLGSLGAFGRMSKNPIFFGVASFYISFFRGTPLLLQIYLVYQGLAQQMNLILSAVTAGIIALSLNYGAYLAEIIRAGIQSIAHGQVEAGMCLGLKPWQIMLKIVAPQAMRVLIPPVFSQFIAMLKDTSLVSALGVWELLFLARSYGRADFRYIEMLLTAAVLYWTLSIVMELIQVRLERQFGKGFAVSRH